MPDAERHIGQYNRNKSLLEDMEKHKLDYTEWKATIIFYCAVHVVEKMLSLLPLPLHSSDHKTRNKLVMITTNDSIRNIATDYICLYNISKKARYDCILMSDRQLKEASQCLRRIEATGFINTA